MVSGRPPSIIPCCSYLNFVDKVLYFIIFCFIILALAKLHSLTELERGGYKTQVLKFLYVLLSLYRLNFTCGDGEFNCPG